MRTFLSSVVAAVALHACGTDGGSGGGNSDPVTSADAVGPCGTICAAEIRCGSTQTQEECTTDCTMGIDGWVREDALAIMAECIDGLTCSADADSCFGMIPALDIHREWSAACTAKLTACDGIDDDICAIDPGTGEEGIIRLFAPVVVEEMLACLDGADCAARVQCLDGVFAKYGVAN